LFLSLTSEIMSRKSQSTLDNWIIKPIAKEQEEVAPLEDCTDNVEEANK